MASLSRHLDLDSGDYLRGAYPTLLHLSMQPDDSFLPPHWREEDFEATMRRDSSSPVAIERVQVPLGHLPSKPMDEYGAVLIGGASYNVSDNKPFYTTVRKAVRDAIDHRVPVLGICLGHQLIAEELGGSVERGRLDPEIGVAQIMQTVQGGAHSLLQGLSYSFSSPTNHADVVRRLPTGSTELAFNHYANQLVEYQKGVIGMQFHPEREKRTMQAIFEKKLQGEERKKQLAALRSVDLREPRKILVNFLKGITDTQQASEEIVLA